jgi:cysteinyl-tRNA synthetase
MSKVAGNDVSIRTLDVVGRRPFSSTHDGTLAKPMISPDDSLAQAKAQVDRFRNLLTSAPFDRTAVLPAAFDDVLDDDFNTPDALALIHRWAGEERRDLVFAALSIFGLDSLAAADEAPDDIVRLAEERQQAREAKDWGTSDRLRDEILVHGWEVRDEAGGFRLVKLQ